MIFPLSETIGHPVENITGITVRLDGYWYGRAGRARNR